MSTIRSIVRAVIGFARDLWTGYEPVAARALIAAVFVLAAAFGLGAGDLPPQVDAGIAFIAVASPLIAGWRARAKVSPVHTIRDRNGVA